MPETDLDAARRSYADSDGSGVPAPAGVTTRTLAIAMIVVGVAVVAATVLAAAGGIGAATDDGSGGFAGQSGPADNHSAAVAPGEQFAGAIQREGVRVETSVEERAFLWRLARADEGARAELVADRYAALSDRADDLARQRERLEARPPNVTVGAYRARRSVLAQQTRGLHALSNQTTWAAATLPDAELEAEGLSTETVREFERRAADLAGTVDREPPEGWGGYEDPDGWDDDLNTTDWGDGWNESDLASEWDTTEWEDGWNETDWESEYDWNGSEYGWNESEYEWNDDYDANGSDDWNESDEDG